MKVKKVVNQLKLKYPGKDIIKNDESNPTEIICEVEPTREHPEYSLAVAVIDKSLPHYHKKATEEYRIIKGKLRLHIGSETIELEQTQKFKISPGKIHWAEGNETWIECRSTPGWDKNDHIT